MKLDPRTKAVSIICANIFVFMTQNLYLEVVLIAILTFMLLSTKRIRLSLKMFLGYLFLFSLYVFVLPNTSGFASAMIASNIICLKTLYPLAISGVLFFATTTSQELMAAMYKMKAPDFLSISFAITIRYFPALKEDYLHIRDAMKLRGVKGMQKVDGMYVPILMSASKISNEILEASITRGLENPCKKEYISDTSMRLYDYAVIIFLVAFTAFSSLLPLRRL